MNTTVAVAGIFLLSVLVLIQMIVLRNLAKSSARLERATDRIEAASLIVKTNLAESQDRADQIDTGIPGEAADAGAQSDKGPHATKETTPQP